MAQMRARANTLFRTRDLELRLQLRGKQTNEANEFKLKFSYYAECLHAAKVHEFTMVKLKFSHYAEDHLKVRVERQLED